MINGHARRVVLEHLQRVAFDGVKAALACLDIAIMFERLAFLELEPATRKVTIEALDGGYDFLRFCLFGLLCHGSVSLPSQRLSEGWWIDLGC